MSGTLNLRGMARHWPVLPVVALAFHLRMVNLFPTFFYGDDAEYATVARYLSHDWLYLSYPQIEHFGPTPFVSQPPLVLYLMSIAFRLVPGEEAGAVLVSVLLGTLTVAVVYALGVLLQGRATGTLAGVLLAALPMHVTMSRKAFLDAGLAFFMALTLLCYVLWVQRRTTGWALATGVAAACAVLSKLPGLLILVPLGLALLWEIAVHAWRALGPEADRPEGRAGLRRTLEHAGVALAPIALLYGLYVGLLWKLKATADFWLKLQWQLGRVAPEGGEAVEVTHVERPWHWYFTDPTYSLPVQLGILVFALAVAGALLLFLRFLGRPVRERHNLAILAWPFVVIAFFTLSARKEWFYMVPVTPAAALFAALPVGSLVTLFGENPLSDPRAWRRAGGAASLALAVALAATPAYAGVGESIEDFSQKDKVFGYGVKEAAHFIHERDPDAAQVGTLLGRFTLHYYNGQPSYHWYVGHDFIRGEIEAGRLKYVVMESYLGLQHEDEWMQGLVNDYNGRVVAEYEREWGNVQVYELHP